MPYHRRARHHRLRRAHPEALQAQGRRAHRRRFLARSACSGDLGELPERRAAPETYGVAAIERRLRPRASAWRRSWSRARAAGRRYAKPAEGASRLSARLSCGRQATLIAVSRGRRALLCTVDEVNFLRVAGKGVDADQARRTTTRSIGFKAAQDDDGTLVVETSARRRAAASTPAKLRADSGRGGKRPRGHQARLAHRGRRSAAGTARAPQA